MSKSYNNKKIWSSYSDDEEFYDQYDDYEDFKKERERRRKKLERKKFRDSFDDGDE
jgi:hypothetical protein